MYGSNDYFSGRHLKFWLEIFAKKVGNFCKRTTNMRNCKSTVKANKIKEQDCVIKIEKLMKILKTELLGYFLAI